MTLVLASPLAGWVAGLDEVPDEAFTALGEGVAIDPTEGTLLAPCNGEVITVAATGHAIAIRAENGAEVLIHIGVDTVMLRGGGFQVHVVVGQEVRQGDRLVAFDLDRVARGARSLITPILVTNGERFEIMWRAQGRIAAGEPLLEVQERAIAPTYLGRIDRSAAESIRFVTGLADGVHARPAARIVAAARVAGVEITVGAHGQTASALSALGLMGLGVRAGDEVTLWAEGPGAHAAFALVRKAFSAVSQTAADSGLAAGMAGGILVGTRGSPGVAIGTAFRYAAIEIEPPPRGQGVAVETQALRDALAAVHRRLENLAEDASGSRSEILQAHQILLDDPALQDAAALAIEGGANAGAAWRSAIRRQTDLFACGGDRRLRERRADLFDLERQVLTALYGAGAEPPRPPPDAVILAQELLPSELAALADLGVAGIAMAGGGATSHVAIMGAALGLPMLTAVSGLGGVPSGVVVILDADNNRLIVSPEPAVVAELQDRQASRARRRAAASVLAHEPCVTADGRRIAVYANLGGAEEAERAVAQGAEGCGLLRSEFLFHDRAAPPDEDEQRAAYQAVADRLQGRPLTIRTLDVGSDKPAAYLALPSEENPALGLRGVRVSLWRPELLRVQLRAILGVRGDVAILVPMVASRHEIAAVRKVLTEEAASMNVRPLPLGVMIETPAAAVTVGDLSEVSDFFSVGSNDLSQYALAMDRALPMLASQIDGLHPAVVALMRLAARDATTRGRKISVCGGLAADRAAMPILIGLGVAELSMPPSEIAEAKALIRTLSAADCRAFAEREEAYEDAAALRRAVTERWRQVENAQ